MTVRTVYEIVGVDKTKAAFRSIERNTERLSSAFQAVGAAALGIGTAMAGIAARTVSFADELGHLSARIGVSTEALSEYRHVAELTGVQFNQLTTAWQRQTRRISEAARGTGEAVKALNELGLSAQALNRLAPEEQFEKIAEAMSRIPNQADRVRLAMRLWDSEGVSLLQTIQGGSQALEKMREEARRLGATVTGDMTQRVQAFKGTLATFTTAMQGLGVVLIDQFLPSLQSIASALARDLPDALTWLNNAINQTRAAIVGLLGVFNEWRTRFNELLRDLAIGYANFFQQLSRFPLLTDKMRGALIQASRGLIDFANEQQQVIVALNRQAEALEDTFIQYDRLAAKMETTEERSRRLGEEQRKARDRAKALADALKDVNDNLTDNSEEVDKARRSVENYTRQSRNIRNVGEAFRFNAMSIDQVVRNARRAADAVSDYRRETEIWAATRRQGELRRFGGNEATAPFQVSSSGTSYVQLGRFRARFEDGRAVGQEVLTGAGNWRVIPGSAPSMFFGSRATGGMVTQSGPHMLEAGERVVSNAVTNNITLNVNGLNMGPDELRAFVRQRLVPELNAARR